MRELKYCTITDKDTNKFRIEGVNGEIKLQKGYETEDDGVIWGLKCGTMIQAHYTEEEKEHKERMRAYKPLEQGELVKIEGQYYKTDIKGNYSDAVIFEPASNSKKVSWFDYSKDKMFIEIITQEQIKWLYEQSHIEVEEVKKL